MDVLVGKGELHVAPEVLKIDCNGSLFSDGRKCAFDRRASPLMVVLGQPELPVVLEMIEGMRLGGKRRVLVPPLADANPESGNGGEIVASDTVCFELELLETETGLRATFEMLKARGRPYRVIWVQVFLLLSFVPYLLPIEQRRFLWQTNGPESGLECVLERFSELTQEGQSGGLMEESLDAQLFGEGIRQLDSELYR